MDKKTIESAFSEARTSARKQLSNDFRRHLPDENANSEDAQLAVLQTTLDYVDSLILKTFENLADE